MRRRGVSASLALFLLVTCVGRGIGSGILALESYKRDATYEQVRSIEREGRADSEMRVARFYDRFLTEHLQSRIDGYLRSGQGDRANSLFRLARGNHYKACLRNAEHLSVEALAYGMNNVKTLDALAAKEADAVEP